MRVRRDHLWEDSSALLRYDSLTHPLKIVYEGEDGIDEGGLLRDWISSMIREGRDSFVQSANGLTFGVQKGINYRLIGMVLGEAVLQNVAVSMHLERVILKRILGLPMNHVDIRSIDPEAADSLEWLRDNNAEDADLYFTAENPDGVKELIEGGRSVQVTDFNKGEYIARMTEFLVIRDCQKEIDSLAQGFWSVVPQKFLKMLAPIELDFVMCGLETISFDDFRLNICFDYPFTLAHPTIVLFLSVVEKFDKQTLSLFLEFVTGSPAVPFGGFERMKEIGKPFTVIPGGSRDRLPVAHTCSNCLALPFYETEDELRNGLLTAIYETSSFEIL